MLIVLCESKNNRKYMGKEMSFREVWMDKLKGFAIICVVLGHAIERTLVGLQSSNVVLNEIDFLIYSFHIPLFFMTSGYVYALKERSKILESKHLRTYIKHKFLDLFVPYLFFAVLVWVGKMLFAKYVTYTVNIKDLLLMFLNPIAFLWFIYILFYVCVLTAVLDNKLKNKENIVLIVFLLMLILRCFVKTDIKLFDRVMFYPLFYYLGVIVYNNKKILKPSNGILAFLAFIITFVVHYKYPDFIFVTSIVNICGCIFFAILFKNLSNLKDNIISYIGKITIYIYILHPIIMNAIRILLSRLNIKAIILWLLILVLVGIWGPCIYVKMSKTIWILDLPFRPRKYLKQVQKEK